MSTRPQFSPDAQVIALLASNLLQIPVNLVNRLSFTGACKQARSLLVVAEKVAAEPLSEVPEPNARAERAAPKRAAYPPDICPPAVMSQD